MTFETLPHDRIPQSCTCKWVPVGNGLWKRTGKPFPGLPRCSFDHEVARLRKMRYVRLVCGGFGGRAGAESLVDVGVFRGVEGGAFAAVGVFA